MTRTNLPPARVTAKRLRLQPARGIALEAVEVEPVEPGEEAPAEGTATSAVDREAGVIRGASAMQAVEALGHGLMLDRKTLDQVAELGNAAPGGVKVRFTHPGLCDDGMGKLLGRMSNFRVATVERDGQQVEQVVGDIQLNDASAKSPDGDLRSYVLDLAEEDPASFGMSVVVMSDHVWKLEDGSEVPVEYDECGPLPAPEGAQGDLPFMRVLELRAVDVVDEAAANRDGLFGKTLSAAFSGTSSELAADVFARLDDLIAAHGIDVPRAQQFLARYFAARVATKHAGAKPATKEDPMGLNAKRLAELCQAHPDHTPTILRLNAEGADEPAILAALATAERERLAAAVTTVTGERDAARADAKTARDELAAEKAKRVELEQQLANLGKLATGAPQDPGPGEGDKPVVSRADLLAGRADTKAILADAVVVR